MNNIKRVSTKRAKEELEYKKIKEEKKAYMVERKFYRCVFCNSKLDPENDDDVGWHHLDGRDGDLIKEWGNITPAHNLCHSDFHHSSVGKLMDNSWYGHFIERIQTAADKNEYFRRAYNGELRRMQKGNVLDMEQYLNMYINQEE